MISTRTTCRLTRQPRRVRLHRGNGCWTICIGKVLDKSKLRLRPKDWYFPNMTEQQANREAERINQRWEFVVTHWQRLYQPTLEVVGAPFADVPHWDPTKIEVNQPSEKQIEEFQSRPPTRDEVADAYENATLDTVYGLYQIKLRGRVAAGEIQSTSRQTAVKNVRCAMTFLPSKLKMDNLTHEVVQAAKVKMLDKLGRRAVKNYMDGLHAMLAWFYDSDYGRGHEPPSEFKKVFSVRRASRTDVEVYTFEQLRVMLDAATPRSRLYIMLGLNMGAYAADIGRLTLDEVNLDKGYVFWDREKEPDNPFAVKHDLWPETLVLVRQFIQRAGTPPRPFTDYRNGKPEQIDASRLAFVSADGAPLYLVRQTGSAKSTINETFKELNRKTKGGWQMHNLRKTTNQNLCELVEEIVDDDDPHSLMSVSEISGMFLSQKSDLLVRLYRRTGVKLYARMNKFLARVGERMRAEGVFSGLPVTWQE